MDQTPDELERTLEPREPLLPLLDPARPNPRSQRFWNIRPGFVRPFSIFAGGIAFLGGVAQCSASKKSRGKLLAFGATAVGVSQVFVWVVRPVWSSLRAARRKQMKAAVEVASRMAWNEALSAVWRIVYSFHDGIAAPYALRNLVRDAEVMKRYHISHFEEACADKLPPSSEKVLIDGRHFASFAMASYGFILLKLFGILEESYDMFASGSHPIDVVMHQLGLEQEDLLLADLDGEHLGIPRHFVARDSSRKCIVITVRGTSSFSDIIVDLLCESAPFGGGYAHSGMKDAAYSLYHAILPTVLSGLEENDGYTVVTVGHSLGAGVAILLTKILLDNGFKKVKCFAISPPPVFGPMHAVDREWSDALECFVNEDDIVPRLSLQSARALAKEMENINKNPVSRKELQTITPESLLSTIAQSASSEHTSERLVSPLYIPTLRGVHWLLPHTKDEDDANAELRYRCVNADTSVFGRILVTPNCVTSHFPNRYIAAFNALPLPRGKEQIRFPVQRPGYASILRYNGELGS